MFSSNAAEMYKNATNVQDVLPWQKIEINKVIYPSRKKEYFNQENIMQEIYVRVHPCPSSMGMQRQNAKAKNKATLIF